MVTGEPYTVDDQTLLRAIQMVEGGPPLSNPIIPSAVQQMVVETTHFKVLADNEHLRALLKTFLEKNIAVERVKNKLSGIRSLGWLERAVRRGEKERLESQLATLEAERDAAFKPYEMLRKLTDNENSLLKRYSA